MFQLQHGKQVKNTLPINKPHIGVSKYIFQKLNKPSTLKTTLIGWSIGYNILKNTSVGYHGKGSVR